MQIDTSFPLFTIVYMIKTGGFYTAKKLMWLSQAFFLIFIVIGASASLGAVIDFSDMMILGMAFPNILGLYFFAGEIKADMKDYFARIKSGAIKKFK